MKYLNAEHALPVELLSEIQKHIEGCALYIPNKKGSRKKWGATTGIRSSLSDRNAHIRRAFASGVPPDDLAREHHLSVESIKKIIYSKI